MNPTLSELIDSLRDWKSQTRSEILLTMAKIQDAIKREKPTVDPTPLSSPAPPHAASQQDAILGHPSTPSAVSTLDSA